jgi:hypothetical protein
MIDQSTKLVSRSWAYIIWMCFICSGLAFASAMFQLIEFTAAHEWKRRAVPIFAQYVDGYLLIMIFSSSWIQRCNMTLKT